MSEHYHYQVMVFFMVFLQPLQYSKFSLMMCFVISWEFILVVLDRFLHSLRLLLEAVSAVHKRVADRQHGEMPQFQPSDRVLLSTRHSSNLETDKSHHKQVGPTLSLSSSSMFLD